MADRPMPTPSADAFGPAPTTSPPGGIEATPATTPTAASAVVTTATTAPAVRVPVNHDSGMATAGLIVSLIMLVCALVLMASVMRRVRRRRQWRRL